MLEPGTHIGDKYRLIEPIGQGGMATVWRAEHITLGRPVAVKFLEAIGTNVAHRRERFLREARMVGAIRHRHVIDVMDFGVTDDGQPYMVMELLEGRSLAERLRQEPPLTDAEVIDILSMTLSGLAAVHDAGIVHRDVKPENVFLVEDADGFFPKLLDFGISRGFESNNQRRLTQTGGVIGTPCYMSPEQARGLKDIDRRSDLFSMGVVLYECLTGKLPFDSENWGDVMIMVASQDPPPVELLRPDLPGPLTDVIDRALARDRDARFQDAREMRDALETARASIGVGPARPPIRREPMPSAVTVDRAADTKNSIDGGYALPTTGGRRRIAVTLAVGALVIALAAGAVAMLREGPAASTPGEPASPPPTTSPATADHPARVATGDGAEVTSMEPARGAAMGSPEATPAAETSQEPEDVSPVTPARAQERRTARRRRDRPRTAMTVTPEEQASTAMAADTDVQPASMAATLRRSPGGFIRDLDY